MEYHMQNIFEYLMEYLSGIKFNTRISKNLW